MISAQAGLDDLVGIANGLAALDLVDILHARNHLAPDGILAVEKGRVAEADEELRIGRIWTRGAGHRNGSAHMRLSVDLGLEVRIFRPSRPGSLGTTGLRHESVDHAVEDDAVVESFGDQALDVRDMAWRKRRVHFDHHRTLARLER